MRKNADMASFKNWGFCDLALSKNYDFNKLHFLERLGYNTLAINTLVEEPDEEPKKKKKKGETRENQDYIPAPAEIPKEALEKTNLNILQRVTIEFTESSIAHKINRSENLKKYDIIAVIPKTLQAFQYACGTLDIDVITFDPSNRIPFKVSRKLYRQAVERGIFFELMYSPAIRDATARKNIISTAHNYHAVGKSRNIVVNSGAEDSMQVRDVNDIINLGFILGLNSCQSLEAVRNNARRLIVKANGRKFGKLYMTIRTVTDEDDNKTPAS